MVLTQRARKLNRLHTYDYSQAGWYYVTICTKHKEKFFGEIKEGRMMLNELGRLAFNYWMEITNHFSFVNTDEFIIMPNHIHGIIVIHNNFYVGDNDRCPLHDNRIKTHRNMELLSKIISQYKSSVSRFIYKTYGNYKFGWQRSFYDHIIRNEQEYLAIRQYIRENPKNWVNTCDIDV